MKQVLHYLRENGTDMGILALLTLIRSVRVALYILTIMAILTLIWHSLLPAEYHYVAHDQLYRIALFIIGIFVSRFCCNIYYETSKKKWK